MLASSNRRTIFGASKYSSAMARADPRMLCPVAADLVDPFLGFFHRAEREDSLPTGSTVEKPVS